MTHEKYKQIAPDSIIDAFCERIKKACLSNFKQELDRLRAVNGGIVPDDIQKLVDESYNNAREALKDKNILLAEFLGLQKHRVKSILAQKNNSIEDLDAYEFNYNAYGINDLRFHESWDWIMAVVEKVNENANITIRVGICTIGRKFMAAEKYAKINDLNIGDVPLIAECNTFNFIGNVYEAVVEYVIWYNQKNRY